jgi:ElaB/YqjD/DUF883 family membrane-anchored ribosome-binding protein
MKTHSMKFEDELEHDDPTANEGKALYNRALEKTREGAKATDEFLHHHTYKLITTGILLGLAVGYLVSQKCRCRSR